MKTRLPRPYEYLEGESRRVKFVLVPICGCPARRGPEGGICGNCEGAIPDSKEARAQRLEAESFPTIPHDPMPDIT